MLTALSIQNVVLIESLLLEFEDGLCVLTGETGAGKSILLESLGLAMGTRADTAFIRKGADQATVSASFEIEDTHPLLTFLENMGLNAQNPVILRRILTSDGRSRAYINDQPVNAGTLKTAGAYLVEILGQFDTRLLMDPSSHIESLDAYAGLSQNLEEPWNAYQAAKNDYIKIKEEAARAAHDEAYLRTAVEDLKKLGPQKGEEENLSVLRDKLMNRERIIEALSQAHDALNTDPDPVRTAWACVERVSDRMGQESQDLIDALARACDEINDASARIQSFVASLDDETHSLESIDDRLFDLRANARKHQCTVDDLPAVKDDLSRQLALIETGEEALQKAAENVEKQKQRYQEAAHKISARRKKAAKTLDGAVAAELEPLKLGKAKFVTQIDQLDESHWGPKGIDKVRFLVSTAPGNDPGPMNKIASGGELSRFMLALKVVTAQSGHASILMFDEVDAGVGGAVADAVGERLHRLSHAKQVMVVTHAPQVAARATHHYVVSKTGDKKLKTTVHRLQTRQDRCQEIARMLSGATITPEALAAAGRLIEAA